MTFDLDREVITWPDGRETQFMRYATKRLPTDPAPNPKDLFKFPDKWRPTQVRSAVYQVPRKNRNSVSGVPEWAMILMILGALFVAAVVVAII